MLHIERAVMAQVTGEQALVIARQRFPDLSGDGIRVYPGSTPQEIHADQIETAMAFLRLLRPTKILTIGSGTLKHNCETWGSVNGLCAYVSRGALTAAAVAMGYHMRAYTVGPHVEIGVSLRDLRKLNDETCELWIARRQRYSAANI
jgi:hypothetical protein